MRVTYGTCAHCSAPVEWSEEIGHYVSHDAGAPDLIHCGGFDDEGNLHNVPDEEE